MTLDFTSYTFSGLIALLAAILGIGYPMFLESIRKIDEQYDSTRLSAKFQRESVFHRYRRALLAGIAVSFCAPFLMLLFPINTVSIVIVTIQAVTVMWLVYQMLAVFQVVQEYYNPRRLLDRLQIPDHIADKDKEAKENLLCLIDTMRYASRRENEDVYKKTKSALIHLTNYAEHETAINAETKDKVYNVSPEIFNAYRLIAKYSKDPKNTFFYNDDIASQVFYNYFFDYHIGPQTYQLLWQSAYLVADSGSDEWFRQHWSYADQYYTSRYETHPNHERTYSEFYREHHFMLGVMAMFYKRYDWLQIVFFHTHAYPPKYPLVPSTYQAIIDVIQRLESQRMLGWRLTQKYQMKGLFADVNSDDKILWQAYRYAALLLVRLFSVNDYNITYSYPMQLPYIDSASSIYKFKKDIELIERLRYHLTSWYKDNELSKVELPVQPAQAEVEKLLDEYKAAIETQMQYNIQHPDLDKDKMAELKTELTKIDKRIQPNIPTHAPETYNDTPLLISFAEQFDNEISAVGGYRDWSNFPDVFLSSLNHKIEAYYDGLYLLIPSDMFTISERNVFKALDIIKPDNEDVILAMGVYLPHFDMVYNQEQKLRYEYNPSKVYYNDVEIISRSANQSSLIVIKRDMMPSVAYLPPSDEMLNNSYVELQGTPTHLCSTVDKVIADNKTEPVVWIGRNVSSHIPAEAKCIRIIVKKNVDDTVEMERLKAFKE